jgi:hypothetical protein
MSELKLEVVKETAKVTDETKNLLNNMSKLPTPVQIVVRALQHFADKAFDSADVQLHFKETEPFLKVSTKRSTLLFERLPASQRYQLYFERMKAGALIVKKVVLECNEETAMKFASALREAFAMALYEGIIDVTRILESFQIS